MSDLSVSTILTYPSISVVGNKIWASCSIPIIWFLVILLPSGVSIFDYSSRLSRKVRKYFCCYRLIFCNHIFFNCFVCVWLNCFATNYSLIFLIFVERNLMIALKIFLSTVYPTYRFILSVLTVMFAKFSKFKGFCSWYAARTFLQLSI